jgi:hypothetical protein
VADKSNFGNPGIGIPIKLSDCKWGGADPPKNDLASTGAISSISSPSESLRYVSAGNGCCIVAMIFSIEIKEKSKRERYN